MATSPDLQSLCDAIRKDYSPCDVSDALLKLGVADAGFLKDILPIPSRLGSTTRLVAPVSTVVFVPKSHQTGSSIAGLEVPNDSNVPRDRHWTDVAAPGSVVLMQQPSDQIAALIGDIVGTRYKVRGIKGIFGDGRARDNAGCGKLCADGQFQVWAKALTSAGTGLEAKPWAVDVPLKVHNVTVRPGDILVADEGEMAACVIPRERLDEVMKLLPVHKEADDGLLKDVQDGIDFKTAVARWPGHYTHHRN